MDAILLPIYIPIATALLVLFVPKKVRGVREAVVLAGTLANLIVAVSLFKSDLSYSIPWAGFGAFEFNLRLYHYSAFTIGAAAAFGFLISLYTCVFALNKSYSKYFYVYFLASLSFLNGAALSSNLLAVLFFWEALLMTQFGMIALGGKSAFKTATKAFIIVGLSDLCMMIGMAIYGHIAGTFNIGTNAISLAGFGGLAFTFLIIGAIAKSGSMPFHSWIPDAAIDAPLPFMAIFPGALEKILGIYFLARISLDMFKLDLNSWASYMLMTIGAITIIFAVMMALVQKDYKKLLSYHAISQIGYMVLGIGTLVPVGIIGGIFHMINNAMYKSCLFLTGGAVERGAGTTNLEKLGGIGKRMPVTFICFIVTALSISGVPPFNGFFSKELVYDGALERGRIFYLAAVIGSFFTAASFLKLGHAAFLGKLDKRNDKVREAPAAMLVPMVIIAGACILFGVYNALPIKFLIQPILGPGRLEGHDYSGFPANTMLVIISVVVLIGAVLNHIYGVKKTGKGISAVDHIHYAPVLGWIYSRAEKGYFDPYNIGYSAIDLLSVAAAWTDKAIDWVYNSFIVTVTDQASAAIRGMHNGSYKLYILWSLGAAALIVIFLIRAI
ncbi:MAG: proton-conducting transporter membrane subunit [Candidatus Omnitrophica bacterium]|nr:proton-conducting transporter membrane subunit [Candidatus Omnitrophota bacterium]